MFLSIIYNYSLYLIFFFAIPNQKILIKLINKIKKKIKMAQKYQSFQFKSQNQPTFRT